MLLNDDQVRLQHIIDSTREALEYMENIDRSAFGSCGEVLFVALRSSEKHRHICPNQCVMPIPISLGRL